MGQGFKEVASLRGDDKKFEENFAKIKWTKTECEFCFQEVNAIDLQLIKVPLSESSLWACDECRLITEGKK
jgi:hypothetical protein